MKEKFLLPIVILGITLLGVILLIVTAPEPERRDPERAIPTVRVIDAETRTLRHTVRSQGTVVPRTEADLVAEISGRVLWISPSFAPGGFFEADDALIRFESRDYELARDRARANVQRARSEREFAVAELARQEGLSDGGVRELGHANLLDARAALEQAERDLARTEIRAPYAGRIREEQVDIGQFVNLGSTIARIYATDYVEVRLPIPDEQLAFLDAGVPPAGTPIDVGPSAVRLSATFAGQKSAWTGRIVRTEGEIDQRSRMVNVVARVEAPYKSDGKTAAVPLAVGLFVHAEIQGPEVSDIIVVPRYAMRNGSEILVVDATDHLTTRRVDVVRIDRDDVLIKGPLEAGDRICVSPVQVVVEGMAVRTIDDANAVAGRGAEGAQ